MNVERCHIFIIKNKSGFLIMDSLESTTNPIQGGKRVKGVPKPTNPPLVSIITVVFNGAQRLEETIVSIKKHLTVDCEYIVVDGGSKDGTVDLLRKYDDTIDFWVSEPDYGIYDAINKGIGFSTGHFFLVLNIGDTLLKLPYPSLRDAKSKIGDVALFKVKLSNNKIITSTIDYRTRFGNTIHHQGAFYRRSLGIMYDLTYKVYSDFDLNQKLFLQGKKFLRYSDVISCHSLDGVSNDRKHRDEYFSIIKKNFGFLWVVIGFLYIWQGEMRIKLRRRVNSSTTPKTK
jgi:glycosyltransferase involved in cell wall biosynthesis